MNSPWLKRSYIWIILIGAAIVRCTGLVRRDFWYDEAFTGVVIKQSWSNMMGILVNDVHPPLYYILVKLFAAPFYYSVYGIRLFSAIAGIVAVWAVYRFVKQVFTMNAALFAAIITALSPFAIQYSQEARMYALLAVLILLAADFFVTGLKTQQTKYFFWWGIITGLSFLTHYISLFFAVLYYVVYLIWKKPIHWKNVLPSRQLLLGYGVALVMFLPWVTQFIYQLQHNNGNLYWVTQAHLGDMASTWQIFLFGTPLGELSTGMPQANSLYGIQNNSIQMVIVIALTISLLYLWRKIDRTSLQTIVIFSIGFMVLIYLLSVTIPSQRYFMSRYLFPAAFFLFIVIGVVLSQIKLRYSTGCIVLYLLLILLIVPRTNSQGFTALAQHISDYPGQHFYMLGPMDYMLGKYYFGADRITLYNKDDPQFDPSIWAGIGTSLQRTETEADIKNDPTALIVSSVALEQDSQYFSVTGLQLVQQYKNVYVYRYGY